VNQKPDQITPTARRYSLNRQRLKELRRAKNVTQAQIAHALKMGRSTYASLESGNQEPYVNEISRIAKYFGVREMELVTLGPGVEDIPFAPGLEVVGTLDWRGTIVYADADCIVIRWRWKDGPAQSPQLVTRGQADVQILHGAWKRAEPAGVAA